jgi:hypothetical protein
MVPYTAGIAVHYIITLTYNTAPAVIWIISGLVLLWVDFEDEKSECTATCEIFRKGERKSRICLPQSSVVKL